MANKKINPSDFVKAAKNVVVCINVTSHKTRSGLEMPNTENKPEMGQVVAIGEGDHVDITTYILNFRGHRPYKALVVLRVIKIQTANALSPLSRS